MKFSSNLNRAIYSGKAYRENFKKAKGNEANPIDYDSGYGYENVDLDNYTALFYKLQTVIIIIFGYGRVILCTL